MKSRRDFLKLTSLAAASVAASQFPLNSYAYNRMMGANERMNVAVIGLRNRAKALSNSINQYDNAHITHNCDVDDLIIETHNGWAEKNIGYVPSVVKDFRTILDDKNVNAVFIVTPEHWHAPMAIMALQAGKHVYVEKPCSHNLFENDMLVKAQKKYGKVVQMGNQQRSAITSINAINQIHEGRIGDVYKGEAYYSNNRESIGHGTVIPVPDTLDWDLWQGPAPREKYRDNLHPYNWHWFRNWGTGEIHNNGTHEIDICRWALGVDYPQKVHSVGGKYTYDDDWEFPDNQQVTYQFAGDKTLTWTGHSRGKMQPNQPGRGATIYGSKGVMTLSRNGTRLYDLGGNLIEEKTESEASQTTNISGGGHLVDLHVANFFNAIKGKDTLQSPIDDAAISTHICHLGNVAQDAGEEIEVDDATGKLKNKKLAQKHYKREYEKGWEAKVTV